MNLSENKSSQICHFSMSASYISFLIKTLKMLLAPQGKIYSGKQHYSEEKLRNKQKSSSWKVNPMSGVQVPLLSEERA